MIERTSRLERCETIILFFGVMAAGLRAFVNTIESR